MSKRKRFEVLVKITFSVIVFSTINATFAEGEEEQKWKEITHYIREMEKVCDMSIDLNTAGWASMEAMYKLIEIGTPTVPKLIEVFEDKTKDWKLRWLIGSEVLGNLKDARAVDSLIRALKDENNEIRKAAINGLGEIGDKRALEPLIETLREGNKDIRMFVPMALAIIEDNKQAVKPLITALKDRYWYVRINAARALGIIGDKEAIEPLIEALKNENETIQIKNEDSPSLECENEVVKMVIIEALGKLRDERAVESLISAMKNDKSAYVRLSATKALGELSKIKSLTKDDNIFKILSARSKPVFDQRIVDSLIETSKSEDELLQLYAVKALVEMGEKRAEELIKKALEKVKDEYVRKSMEEILKELKSP